MKKITIICGAGILFISLASCTRAKPEIPTPTIAISAAVPTHTVLLPTPTEVFTPQVPPTALPLTAGPTVISVAEVSPTAPLPDTPTAIAPTPLPSQLEYTVQWGDTLYSIARRFNTTIEAIMALNGLQNPNAIKVGQVLKITGTPSPSPIPSEYVVQPGDTLFSIARRFNTTVDAICRANGLINPWYIRVGQKLVIPLGSSLPSSGSTTYVVQPGDTVYSIAARFGKNVWDIIVANNLSDPYWIGVGQVLVIP